MRYAIVIENAAANFSAYVPDLPGCVATGPRSRKSSARFARPLSSISKACARMVRPFLLPRALSATLTSRPNPLYGRARTCLLACPRRRCPPVSLIRWAS